MRRKLLLIFKLLLKAKFVFKNPKEHKLVIFDDESYMDMKNFIFNYNFFLIYIHDVYTNILKIHIYLYIYFVKL